MSLRKFKVGDIVRCIDCGPNRMIETGKIYKVTHVYEYQGSDYVIGINNMDHSYYEQRFELVKTLPRNYKPNKGENDDIIRSN